MLRLAGLWSMGLLLMAASPAPHPASAWTAPLLAEATIAPSAVYPTPPPAPAAAEPGALTAAPVPDADQSGPVVAARQPGEAEFSPSLFHSQGTYRGEGFTPGSSVQASERRNIGPAPGVSLNVPLE